mmetsp:Transcript_33470/g.105752  ORF Transcript_33470/g.105752 Transcript_33470/m.105752 type:complete len:543 (-) Transcript_33470:180-1808(-)
MVARFGPGCREPSASASASASSSNAKATEGASGANPRPSPNGAAGRTQGLDAGVAPLLAWTRLGAPNPNPNPNAEGGEAAPQDASLAACLPLEEHAKLALSLFGQLEAQLAVLPPAQQRLSYTHPMDDGQKRSFKVKFEGEGVDDYGGPYREIFTQVAAELQATAAGDDAGGEGEAYMALPALAQRCVLPLLVPTGTALNYGVSDDLNGDLDADPSSSPKAGLGPGSVGLAGPFVPNPGADAPVLLEHFHFFGKLLGIAIRSHSVMQLSLPLLVWKRLVGELAAEEDLAEVDTALLHSVQQLRALLGDKDALREVCASLRWTVTLGHGREVPLPRPNPKGQPTATADDAVLPEELPAYLDALVAARLNESEAQVSAMRDGLCSIVPASALALLTGPELRSLVCGRAAVDVDLLARNTDYDDELSPSDPHVLAFWRVLRGRFDDAERAQFLRFVWARPQLPPDDRSFTQKFKMQPPIGEDARRDPDRHLPKAHTCFFSLNLPRYTSEDIMAERMRYAMQNCVEMDADFRLSDGEMTGWDIDEA